MLTPKWREQLTINNMWLMGFEVDDLSLRTCKEQDGTSLRTEQELEQELELIRRTGVHVPGKAVLY